MRKGLKVIDGVYINLDNICVAIFEEKSLQLQFSDENLIDVHIPGASYPAGHKVEINEFKRIEREVKEYLEVDKNQTVKETAVA